MGEIEINSELVRNFLNNLVNKFFKILPMREQEEKTLNTYIKSLQVELLGCKELVAAIKYDDLYLTLLSILQYLIDYPECSVNEVKREVFRAISVCNKLKSRYFSNEVVQ